MQDEVQIPKKSEELLLLSKYPMIMGLDAELKRRNEEIFAVEQECGNLEMGLFECTGVFKQKQRKKLQERIVPLGKKGAKMTAELSQVLQNVGYANVAEFFTELFVVFEEKLKYEDKVQLWEEQNLHTKQYGQVCENQEEKVLSANRYNVVKGKSR